MVTRKKIAQLIDRRGGRSLLAALTTRAARSLTSDTNVSVIYDEMWIDVIDGKYLPRSASFNYNTFDLKYMRRRAECRLAGSLDYWTHVYRPRLAIRYLMSGEASVLMQSHCPTSSAEEDASTRLRRIRGRFEHW